MIKVEENPSTPQMCVCVYIYVYMYKTLHICIYEIYVETAQ
jgi:hypothetical protein